MRLAILLAASATAFAASAFAAPKPVLLDFSNEHLIDHAGAIAELAHGVPARVWKVYPASKWAIASQVEGGITAAGACVVTARVMLLPLTPTMKAVLFRPEKIATAFDTAAGASEQQCRELAKTKLQEATQAVVSSLVSS